LYLVIHFRRNVDLQSSERGDPMKISARNQIQGTITDITKGATTSHVRLDVGGGTIITASITNESVDEIVRAFVAAGARAEPVQVEGACR
jgi:molybdopterin-binding protein